MIKGIDVSRHNGNIDWGKVKKAGINFVIIRAGYGYSTVDENFKKNIDGALKVGLNVGVYWFSYAFTVQGAEKEAKFLCSLIEPYKGKITMPICFDWEYDSYNYAVKNHVSPNQKLVSDMTIKFLTTVENNGWYAMNYTNIDYANRFFNDEIKKRFDTWIAQWSAKCTYTGNYGIWQYGAEQNYIDSFGVDGISGIVDKDYAYKDYPSIIKNAGLNGFGKEKYYTTQKDETFSKVAEKNNVSESDLLKLNANIILKEGQKIRIK